MKNPVLNRILLVVSILGILFLAVYGLYSFTDFWRAWIPKTTDNSLPQKATSSDAANLKTYQNDFLSFTFKYSSNLTYTSEFPQEPQLYEGVSFYDEEGEGEKAVFTLQINQVSPSDHKAFNFASQAKPNDPAFYEEKKDDDGIKKIAVEPLIINGLDWVKKTITENDQTTISYLILKKKKPAVYTVSLYGTADLLEDIVKTFSFIKT